MLESECIKLKRDGEGGSNMLASESTCRAAYVCRVYIYANPSSTASVCLHGYIVPVLYV